MPQNPLNPLTGHPEFLLSIRPDAYPPPPPVVGRGPPVVGSTRLRRLPSRRLRVITPCETRGSESVGPPPEQMSPFVVLDLAPTPDPHSPLPLVDP